MQKSLKLTRPENYQEILTEIEPSEQETVSILHSIWFFGYQLCGRQNNYSGQGLCAENEVKIPFIGEINEIGQYETYIVTDKQYDEMRRSSEELTLHGINITEPRDSLQLVEKIAGVMKTPAVT